MSLTATWKARVLTAGCEHAKRLTARKDLACPVEELFLQAWVPTGLVGAVHIPAAGGVGKVLWCAAPTIIKLSTLNYQTFVKLLHTFRSKYLLPSPYLAQTRTCLCTNQRVVSSGKILVYPPCLLMHL